MWDTIQVFETDVLDIIDCGIDIIIIQSLRCITSCYIQVNQNRILQLPKDHSMSSCSGMTLKECLLAPYGGEHNM